METGELLTRWTARIAAALYALAVLRSVARGPAGHDPFARCCWTAGCAVFLVHVCCAFQFYHHWSHANAYAHTAERTKSTVGWEWGGGLFANYLFTLIWLADVAWWWIDERGYCRRPRAVAAAIHAFLAFMMVNATIVFGQGPVRWFGLAAAVAIIAVSIRRLSAR